MNEDSKSNALTRLRQAAASLASLRVEIDVKLLILRALQSNVLNTIKAAGACDQAVSDVDQLFVSVGIAGSYGQLKLSSRLTRELSTLAAQASNQLTELYGDDEVIRIEPGDFSLFVTLAEHTERTLCAINFHHETIHRIFTNVDVDMHRLQATNALILSRVVYRQTGRP
jgi:hypothetical protein